MDGILIALLGFTGAGFLAFLLAMMTGQLVSKTKLDEAEKRADQWKTSSDTFQAAATHWQEAHTAQSATLLELRLSTQMNNQVIAAVRDVLRQQTGGGGTT